MIKLAHSKLTDRVYAVTGKQKIDVTNDFIFCAISRWKGFVETVTDNEGNTFKISVKHQVKDQKNKTK